MVRALASRLESLWFEPESRPQLNAHCSPSSKWIPGGNTREIKATRKGLVTLPSLKGYFNKITLSEGCICVY